MRQPGALEDVQCFKKLKQPLGLESDWDPHAINELQPLKMSSPHANPQTSALWLHTTHLMNRKVRYI